MNFALPCRTLRAASGAEVKQRAWRRFETPPAEELQIDWSPYSVPLGGKITRVVAFAATLCWSRKLHVRFYTDERQAALLAALLLAVAPPRRTLARRRSGKLPITPATMSPSAPRAAST